MPEKTFRTTGIKDIIEGRVIYGVDWLLLEMAEHFEKNIKRLKKQAGIDA